MLSHGWIALLTAMLLAGPPRADPPHWRSAMVVTDATLAQAAARLVERSPSFRAALDSVATLGRTILLLSLDEVIGADEQLAREGVAVANPVVQPDSSVQAGMVILNLRNLRAVYEAAGVSAEEFERDLMRIIAHEVYGHAIPYVLAGHVRESCPDPRAGEHDACSIRRENVVRAEAGLGLRRSYDLSGLSIGRYLRQRPL
jgi:hypothetical protein